jgi:hypothetical protein
MWAHTQGISIETFSAFPHDKLDDTWIMVPVQEAHAKAILESSTNLRDIRFKLCPSQLRDEVDCVSPHVARLHRLHTPAARRLCRRTQTTAGPREPSATDKSPGTSRGR